MKVTPRPWKYDGRSMICIPAEDGEYCFRTRKEDAAFIVKCVNLHDELVVALNGMLVAAKLGPHVDGEDAYRYAMEVFLKAKQ